MNTQSRTSTRNRALLHWVLALQYSGLALVLLATPIFFRFLFEPSVTASAQGFFSNRGVTIATAILFLALIPCNTLAVMGIRRMQQWVRYFFFSKLGVLLFLIGTIVITHVDALLLVIYIPLVCSLCFLVLAYWHMTRLYRNTPVMA